MNISTKPLLRNLRYFQKLRNVRPPLESFQQNIGKHQLRQLSQTDIS